LFEPCKVCVDECQLSPADDVAWREAWMSIAAHVAPDRRWITKVWPVKTYSIPSVAAIEVVVKQGMLEIAVEHSVEILIHNHFEVAIAGKGRPRRLSVLVKRAEENGQAIGVTDIPTRAREHFLFRDRGQLLAGNGARVVIRMRGVITIEIAGAAHPV